MAAEAKQRSPYFLGVGGAVSADIAVPNHKQELDFYSKVLTAGDRPRALWRDDLNNNLGTPIIGLGPRTPEYESLPTQWMPHFQVADIAVGVATAIELGGKALMHNKSADGKSQWAVVADPSGAAFGLIAVVPPNAGYSRPNEPFGHIAGLSIFVDDADSTRKFYERVFGWKSEDIDAKGISERSTQFNMCSTADDGTVNVVAEIIQLAENQPVVPSVWLLHLPVGDFANSVQQVQTLGGKVLYRPTGAYKSCAVVQDPIGVAFALQSVQF